MVKYSLRGISTSPHTVYVLEKTMPEDSNDIMSTEAKDWQWWKIAYLRDDVKPVVYTRLTEESVLQAARTDSTNALLVYASDKAISYEAKDLAVQLHNFVRADNIEFSKELEESTYAKPTTPTKRRAGGSDSDDLGIHHHRSPPHDRSLIDTRPSSDETDGPPEYSSSYKAQSIPRKPVIGGSYDETIPTALQVKDASLDSEPIVWDGVQADDSQEMQRRSSVYGYNEGHNVPDIVMEDEEGS